MDEELRRFVEDAIGGRVQGAERAATGASRLTLLVEAVDGEGRARSLVVRHDSGDGPMSGTGIDLVAEARVYRALAGSAVRIPRLLAEASDGRTLLVERVSGSEDFAGIEDEVRKARVAADFATALAELHRVDATTLDLGTPVRAGDPASHGRDDLARWRAIAEAKAVPPVPTLELAGEWLAENLPGGTRTSLCHGDAGVGNFLHDEGRVTALLDWEFAHLGDPLDDVAWVLVRSHLLGGEDAMRAALPVWSERAGLPLAGRSIASYRALVLLRMAISCQVALLHAERGSAMDATTYRLLLPYLLYLLPQALREAGCDDASLPQRAKEGEEAIAAVPVLQAAAKPLRPWNEA